MEDLEVLGAEIDEDALSQYINLDELNVMSLSDLQHIAEVESSDLNFELSNLEKCSIAIDSNNQSGWVKLLENGNKYGFRLFSDDNGHGNFYVGIDTIEQLQVASEYVTFDDYYSGYKGWFEYPLLAEEAKSDDIMWAGNMEDGTRFGIKMDGDRMFRIAANRGKTFVYLDSNSSNTLEAFLGKSENKIEQEYETDSDYDDNGRDYDD